VQWNIISCYLHNLSLEVKKCWCCF